MATFADWNRMLAIDQFYGLQVAGYPGWNLTEGHPATVGPFVVVKGSGPSSREMAVAFDDVATGNFYYRDWTDSGLPFVAGGGAYRSCFWFQYTADAQLFERLFFAGRSEEQPTGA